MKKALAILLAFGMVCVFMGGCGSKDATPAPATGTATAGATAGGAATAGTAGTTGANN